METLINHKRFKKIFTDKDLKNYIAYTKIFDFPQTEYAYFNFFNNYAKKNYTLLPTKCLCKKENDILLSKVDRHGVEFHTVICKECGLIRAKEYFSNDNINDFYKNHYRKIWDDIENSTPEYLYNQQIINFEERFEIIKNFGKINFTNQTKILDLGGGTGGSLEIFKPSKELYLADYHDPYLNFARNKDINVIKGGLKEIKFSPDLIILSHVVEHWSDFEYEINELIRIQKKNITINYIEFPGIDSLKLGRRSGDLLGDIQIPHIYYFTSYVFENLMSRYGFKKIYIDSKCRSLFLYDGIINKTDNYFKKVEKDLLLAEKQRNFMAFKKIVRLYAPKIIFNFLKSIFGKKIVKY